jgi:Dimethlysulfonioproprionate lyase
MGKVASEALANGRWVIGAIGAALARDHGAEPGVAEVLARLSAQDLGDATGHAPEARRLPACAHLPELAATAMFVAPGVSAAIAAIADDLRWVQNPNYRAESFAQDYAYCELIGPQGFFPGDDFLLGLMIIGPDRIYRDHFHAAPELYWLLTGPTDWSHASGPYVAHEAGDTLWHPPNLMHATRTLHAPLLAVWAWTRDVSERARFA